MTETLERDELIALLNRLGDDMDEEVLAAARQVHARINAAGIGWEDLLVPDQAEGEGGVGDDQEPEAASDETPGEQTETNAESLALIDKLLAKTEISEELRTELEDYKTDIAEGDFSEGDRRYLRAMYERLAKRS